MTCVQSIDRGGQAFPLMRRLYTHRRIRFSWLWLAWPLLVMAACLIPGQAQALTGRCTADVTAELNVNYYGTALSNFLTVQVSCTNAVAGTNYHICTNGLPSSGNGGTTLTPYRQLALGGVKNKANWQLYTTGSTAILSDQMLVAIINGSDFIAGMGQMRFNLKFPVQILAYGVYTTGNMSRLVLTATSASCGAEAEELGLFTMYYNYRVTVAPMCTSLTATTLDFGDVTSTAAPINGLGSIAVTCGPDIPYQVFMSSGSNSSGGNRMKSGGNYLAYALYSDSSRNTAWTSTAGITGSGTGSAQSIPVYGQIAAQATPPIGSYADTVVVTLRY